GPGKGDGKGKGRDSSGASGGPATMSTVPGSGGANPPAGTTTIPSAMVGQVPMATWTEVVCASQKRPISQTSPPPVPPASASPTRHFHPHRVVVALPQGVKAEPAKLRIAWPNMVKVVTDLTKRVLLKSWSLTNGANLVLTVGPMKASELVSS